MCMFSNSLGVDDKAETILEKYKTVSGVECNAYNFESSTSIKCKEFSSEKCDYVCMHSFGYSFKMDFHEVIQYHHLFKKPYIFCCHNLLYSWAVLIQEESRYLIFTGGPVRLIGQKPSDDDMKFKSAEFCDKVQQMNVFPEINHQELKYYSQMLYDLVFLHYSKHMQKAPYDENQLFFVPPQLQRNDVILGLGSQSIIKQKMHNHKKNIDIILKCAINGNRDQAKAVFEELVSTSDNEDNEQYNLAFIVGMISLLGQTVAESVDFSYTEKLFWLYSKFLQDIRELDYDRMVNLLPSFFDSLWNELYISGQVGDSVGLSNKVIEYIRKNYHKGIGVNEVAKDLYINPSYMSRIFKNETGITVKHFITHYRMNMAAEKLITTKLSLQQISEQCGYRDLQAFRKTFKAYFNMSPNQYRNTTKTYF